MGRKTNARTTLVSLCPGIGQYRFFLCIGLQCFGSSSSKVVTFPYKCSMRSTLCQLPAPAGKSQLFSASVVSTQSTFWQLQLESCSFSVVRAVDFGSSGSKIAAFQFFSTNVVHKVHFGSSREGCRAAGWIRRGGH